MIIRAVTLQSRSKSILWAFLERLWLLRPAVCSSKKEVFFSHNCITSNTNTSDKQFALIKNEWGWLVRLKLLPSYRYFRILFLCMCEYKFTAWADNRWLVVHVSCGPLSPSESPYLFSLTSLFLFLNSSFTGKMHHVASHTCNRTPLSICRIGAPLLKWNRVVWCAPSVLSSLQALSGEMSPFLCSGSHQAQRDCQPSALNCFVEAMSQCVPPIPIRPCVLKYLGKTHNLWLRSTLMLEQQAFEKGLSLHSKPKQSTEFYEQESITPPQQVMYFNFHTI